jgi:heterotetrameric sarcosine oxidase delta subunit
MRIACPFCGERDAQEFAYLGDARLQDRPQTPAGAPLDEAAQEAWHDYVYLRQNPAGEHDELWYHASGCRQWLTVTRHMRSHEITTVKATRPANQRGAA